MLIKREKLEEELRPILQRCNSKRKVKDKIIKKFQEFGYVYGEINAIISGTNPLIQLEDGLLGLLVIILYEMMDDDEKKIKPETVLTIQDMKIAKRKVNRKAESIYPIVIENVNADWADDYSTVFEINTIAEYFYKRIFQYNFETQRPRIHRRYCGEDSMDINLNKKNTKEMTDNIVKGNQIPDEITLNILQTGEEEMEYDPIKRTLTILSGSVDVIDGWHRIIASIEALAKKPSVEFYLKVRIVHWDEDRAKAFIHQKSLGTQLSYLDKKAYNVFNGANQIVKKLNEDSNSIIRGKVTTDKREIEKGDALVMFNVLFDAIDNIFEVTSNKDVVLISKYLKNGIGVLTDIDMSILDEEKDDRVWAAYMIILCKYYQKDGWQEKVVEAVCRLDMDELIQIQYGAINKQFINRVNNYITERMVTANV